MRIINYYLIQLLEKDVVIVVNIIFQIFKLIAILDLLLVISVLRCETYHKDLKKISYQFIRYLNETKKSVSPERKSCFEHMMLTILLFQDNKVLLCLFSRKLSNITTSKSCSWLQVNTNWARKKRYDLSSDWLKSPISSQWYWFQHIT